MDPSWIAESLPQDSGCLTPDLMHDSEDGHAHPGQEAKQSAKPIEGKALDPDLRETDAGRAYRNTVFQELETDALEDLVSPVISHARQLLRNVRDEVKVWPPILGKNEEEGRDILRSMACSQAMKCAHDALSPNSLSLSEVQAKNVRQKVENVIDEELDSWSRSCGRSSDVSEELRWEVQADVQGFVRGRLQA